MKKEVSLFLDSGAFSAMTQGVKIELQDYIDFIKAHKQYIDVYANLDVIGDPIKSDSNYQEMKRQGLKPIPVYHLNDFAPQWLTKMMKESDYIAIGGMVGTAPTGKTLSREEAEITLEELFSKYICDKQGIPRVKVHGFGLTSLRWMFKFPWYSVDSTSWVITGRMGGVFVPRYRQGKYIYNENAWKVSVSSRSPKNKEMGEHISNFTPLWREIILDYFKIKGYKLGKSEFKMESVDYELKKNERWNGSANGSKREIEIIVEPGLCNDYRFRDELNIIFFTDLEKTFPEYPQPFKPKTSRGFSL